MTVSNGQDANQDAFNDGFLSKLANSITVAIIGLENVDAASGPVITNLQKAINNLTYKVSSIQTVTASGEFGTSHTIGQQFRPVIGDGPITTSNTPFGSSAPIDGTIVKIMGTDDTNTVTIPHNDAAKGCIINGSSVTLKRWNSIVFIYFASLDRYIEDRRNF